MRIVGLDLSLTSTGVATIDEMSVLTSTITSSGKANATLTDRARRINRITTQVLDHCLLARLVVVEGPAYSKTMGSMHDRSGLWWHTVGQLVRAHVDVVEIPPANLKKYATGKGTAAKDHVLATVVRRYPDVDVKGNDDADALVLAAMGARWLGHPIETSLPKLNLEAMDTVHWPEATS